MFVLVDTGLMYLNQYINKWYAAQKAKAILMQQKKNAKSKTVIKRKVTNYKSKSDFTNHATRFLLAYSHANCHLLLQIADSLSHRRKVRTLLLRTLCRTESAKHSSKR